MSARQLERLAGVLYLITHVTSVAAVILYGTTAGPSAPLAGRTPVLWGAVLEIVLALAVTGTGITLYPLLRRQAPTTAAGYLALRTLEASVILVGVVVLLPIVAAPATPAAPGLSSDVVAALRLVHDWTFLVGPGLIVPVHTVLLAAHLWVSRAVPRWIPLLGLVGGPLVGLANLLQLAGLSQVAVAAIPVFAWEISWAVWLLVRGLRRPT
ncbi:DUF4386 domain-containing protein [Aestuariimicrobium soli]|uniref:DUF4386 domain-containing protein n=1 Tax=Aestuariimicrobium soli TaxID=2035834 RepID=UPI003EBA29BD